MDNLLLRPIEDSDIIKMERWLNKDRIRMWYDDPSDWLEEIRERNGAFSFLKHFIIVYQGKEIVFCQYYKCPDGDSEWDGDGSYSIDYLIGEDDFLHKGFGKAAVSLLIAKVFSHYDAIQIIVSPDEGNTASKRTLLSNGFIFNKEKGKYYLQRDDYEI